MYVLLLICICFNFRPIPSKDLIAIINNAHGSDQSTAMLTQVSMLFRKN